MSFTVSLTAMEFYLPLKLVHILCAIVAVGANMSYALWFALAKRYPEHALFTLKGIKRLDDVVANPAYFGALVSGHILMFVADFSFSTTWIWLGEGLFVLQGIIALPFYSPLLKRQIALVESSGLNSEEYRQVERRATMLGWILNLLALVIVAVMVFKPTWGM